MRTRRVSLLSILVLTASCSTGAHPQPPADSSAVIHAQLKLGDTVISTQGAEVTVDFFDRAGIRPLIGRFFIEGDQRLRGGVVVLSHDLWTGRFGATPATIGRTVELDGRSAIVVGVAPSTFAVPAGAEFWIPK